MDLRVMKRSGGLWHTGQKQRELQCRKMQCTAVAGRMDLSHVMEKSSSVQHLKCLSATHCYPCGSAVGIAQAHECK